MKGVDSMEINTVAVRLAITGCSVGFAYSIIKKINDRLEQQGYIIPRHGHTLRRKYYEMTGGE